MNRSSLARWWFEDRRTGRTTVVQRPNVWSAASMTLALAGLLLRGRPAELARTARTVTGTVWGLDELARGVNPWRRALGATALAVQLRGLRRSRRS